MKNLLSLFVMCCAFAGFTQSKLQFDAIDHDFGEIKEDGGYASYTFNFTNIGEESITLKNVKASCGCTTPGWSREALQPGDSGFVKVQYNPRNRPGRFRKSLQITTTDPSSDQTLFITGVVRPKPKTLAQEYPISAGDLRLKRQGMNFGKVSTEKPIQKSFEVYNGSDSVVSLAQDKMRLPAHISVELVPQFLNPREVGNIAVTFNAKAKADYGFVSDNIELDTASDKSLSVLAIIEEYFPEMTAAELDRAPKIQLSSAVYDFGTVPEGEIVETSIELQNTGREQLEFRVIKSNCDCVTYTFDTKRLRKGKSRTLSIKFDTTGMRGRQYKSVSLYTNDPVTPSRIINLRGKVEKNSQP